MLNHLCETLTELKVNETPLIEAHKIDSRFSVTFELDPELRQNFSELEIENLKIEVKVKKMNNNSFMIFFTKLGGDRHEFFELYNEVIDKLIKA